jgi:hypothetical protein
MRNKDSKRSVLHSIKRNTWNDTITSETAETLANAVNRRITYRHSDTVASIASLEGETPGSVELSEEECEALYREIGDRYKWFTRFYVSNGRKEHVQFFNETDCSYNV